MTKFNKHGQWTLGADGGGTSLLKGFKTTGQEISTGKEPDTGLKGADIAKMAAAQIATGQLPELVKAQPQPTNEEMFGHLVVSEEALAAKEAEWASGQQDKMKQLSMRIDHLNKSKVEGSWATGKSFNSMLSKEELAARNGHVGEE